MTRVVAGSRIKVGDTVQIVKKGKNFSEKFVGQIGKVMIDDGSDIPFEINTNIGDVWTPEDCVTKVSDNLRHTDGKPVTAFEAGKWYQWAGPKERQSGWASDGGMDGVLDGKPHLCIRGSISYAAFDCADRRGGDGWYWRNGFEHFREVPAPMSKSELVKNIELFDKSKMVGRTFTIGVDTQKETTMRASYGSLLGTPWSECGFEARHCYHGRQISTRATIRKRLLNIE